MRKLILCLLLLASPIKAQRVLIGPSFNDSFNNESMGVFTRIELPAKNIEADIANTFSPFEIHGGLGHGKANLTRATGIVWADWIGASSSIEYSAYHAGTVKKGAWYVFAGPAFRFNGLGIPNRLTLSYVREIKDGVTRGIETSKLQGGNIEWMARLGCTGMVCYRMVEDFSFGHIYEQGNPVCDGAYGVNTCPRKTAWSGGVSLSLSMEFGHRGSKL